jgi:predicted DNA-binding protein
MASDATLSLRVPQHFRDRLDRAAQKTQRPLSYLIQRAVERHLDDIESEEDASTAGGRYARLRQYKGAIAKLNGPRSKKEIDDYIDWLRGDD